MHIFQIFLVVVVLLWFALGALLFWSSRTVKTLRPETELPVPRSLPRVSIILAARNEEDVLHVALDSLLSLEYPSYEIILVDDDSHDRTGEIAEEYAGRLQAAGKLRVIHNHALPAGWRGKVHALSLAEKAATGDWILATDADVAMHPRLLRLAVSVASETGADLVSVAPEFEFSCWSEKIVLPAFAFLLGTLFPARLVNSSKSRRAIAAGAFLLMKRERLASLGGYPALRATLIEDLRMAEMFKRRGFPICLAFSRGLFRTRMYRNWREMFEGLARSAFEGFGSSAIYVLGGIIGGNSLAVLPWVVAAAIEARSLGHPAVLIHNPTFLLTVGAIAASIIVYVPVVVHFGLRPWYALTLPLAVIFYSSVAAASTAFSVAGPGLRWKGRTYQPPAS